MPLLVYSLLRLALFAVVTALLWWAGMRSWVAPLLGAFLAFGLSYVLLAGPRDAAALHLARRAEERRAGRTSGRAADDAAAEDAALDGTPADEPAGTTPADPPAGTTGASGAAGTSPTTDAPTADVPTADAPTADVPDVTAPDEATRRDPA